MGCEIVSCTFTKLDSNGVFLSGYDLFIQRSFYGSPEHVAVVVDPKASAKGEVGVFVWEDGDVSRDYSLIVYQVEG